LLSGYSGCFLGQSIINHFLYADDVVLFAPSAKGLQELLDVCSKFAMEHDITFNNNKSIGKMLCGQNAAGPANSENKLQECFQHAAQRLNP
jgi:Reverse transcriptase (RNA-dependent DNA polymerase)